MSGKTLALTFDDGPSQDTMPAILDLLGRYQVRATFFIRGDCITHLNIPLLREAVSRGHELANHSMHHRPMGAMSREQLLEEVLPLQDLLDKAAGYRSVLFRAPYLQVSRLMKETIPLPMIGGSDSRDWIAESDAASRIRLVKEASDDGAIILMHCFPGNTETISALSSLLPWFSRNGYTVTTVSDLFDRKAILPRNGVVYNRIAPDS